MSRAALGPGRPFLVGVSLGLLVVGLLALALLDDTFIGFRDEWSRMHDIDELAQSIGASGQWGVAVSIGLMVAHLFIPFPAEVIALANGIIYGAIFGTLITWTGAMLGAQGHFGPRDPLACPSLNAMSVPIDARVWIDGSRRMGRSRS